MSPYISQAVERMRADVRVQWDEHWRLYVIDYPSGFPYDSRNRSADASVCYLSLVKELQA